MESRKAMASAGLLAVLWTAGPVLLAAETSGGMHENASSLPGLFSRGGWSMWPVLACAIAGTALFIERLLELRPARHAPKDFDKDLVHVVDTRGADAGLALCLEKHSSLARVLYAALLRHGISRLDMESAALDESRRLRQDLRQNCVWLFFCCYMAPLTGLLGGLCSLFTRLDSAAQTGELAGSAANALIPLIFGMAAALPLLAGGTLVSMQADEIARNIAERSVDALVMLDRKARRSMRLLDDIEENMDTQEMRAAPANLDAEFEENECDKPVRTNVTTPAHAPAALTQDSPGASEASPHATAQDEAQAVPNRNKPPGPPPEKPAQ